ncbi:MAG: hypothetical protein ACXWC9_00205 [Pseudobdellovibrionaceae bacterium]
MTTPLILFHRQTGAELHVSSGQWAVEHSNIGKSGMYAEYEIRWEDQTGTFRCFRDHHVDDLRRLGFQRQLFVEDIAEALGFPDFQWKGPSWSCFYHAAFNQRPVSVITARGHEPDTIKHGVKLIVDQGHLPIEPNYLSIYPVSNKGTRHLLGDAQLTMHTAELKQRAIRASVQTALQVYGYNPHHRFGMSDDDPKNIQLIIEEMTRLKAELPELSFFMIETQKGEFVKHEITLSGLKASRVENLSKSVEQIKLF